MNIQLLIYHYEAYTLVIDPFDFVHFVLSSSASLNDLTRGIAVAKQKDQAISILAIGQVWEEC
jgi:hypothetical protein